MQTRGDRDVHGQSRRPLGCVECNFKCNTGNEMSRHIYATRHGTVKCPLCDTYIVPRGFFASLTKLIERHRDRQSSAPEASVSPPLSSSSSGGAGPLTSIAITHDHCIGLPDFKSYEKADFELPGSAQDYNLLGEFSSNLQDHNTSAALVPCGSDNAGSSRSPFRCMECLNLCGTWTKATKHMDKSGHTLPLCVQCLTRLRCFGPQRPVKHEESTGHCGFYGVFYTRRDYLCEVQAPRYAYNYSNSYTGLSTLQYKCVCGISFLHPLHLAEHLRRVHHATSIPNEAVCRRCEAHGTLEEMMVHLRHGCQQALLTALKTGSSVTFPDTFTSPLMGSVLRPSTMPSPNRVVAPLRDQEEQEEVGGSCGDNAAVAPSVVEVPGFTGASFLQWRPLLPPITADDVPLMDESYAMSGDIYTFRALASKLTSSSLKATAEARKASYVVLYQCRECLFLFSSWERMVHHIHATGHCTTYCCKCKCCLPQLVNHSAPHDASGAQRSSAQHSAYGCGTTSASPLICSTTLSNHLDHLRRCGDIIGFPASPRSLEVLVDANAECYQGSLDPAPDLFTGDRVVMAYQCPAEQLGCYEVFLNYGNLVEHLMSTGHGSHPCADDTEGADNGQPMRRLSSCYPMVTYRAKFTVLHLRDHFGFAQCAYCESAVPRGEEALHKSLCIMYRRMED
ncbi:hypothetical protein LSCM1_03052 [Leishmania martiniquensis]|uniref:C2H2-type domain-containing protein n=1 Tax=Leishmania martiniquensis TaxID=1580590 RepID=A0A836H304_9TRYP|nr:hypothetical protein LSCM1_03052 [Leishmania martiniquensis]